MPPPIAHDVKLNFGRPDIARFILDSFDATPSLNTQAGLVGTGMLSSTMESTARPGSSPGPNGGKVNTPGGQRLDSSQVQRASSTVVWVTPGLALDLSREL